MDNVILRATLAAVWKCLIVYSIYILLRGHNDPGGGFIGGLLLALGLIIRGYLEEYKPVASRLLVHFAEILGVVLIGYMIVLWVPILDGAPVLTGIWTKIWVPIAGKFSSVLVFDVAVYLIVTASAVYSHSVLTQNSEKDSAS
jgi:multicomponent Na+:H+ antiporter subunit B